MTIPLKVFVHNNPYDLIGVTFFGGCLVKLRVSCVSTRMYAMQAHEIRIHDFSFVQFASPFSAIFELIFFFPSPPFRFTRVTSALHIKSPSQACS